ncbi:histidine kinase [Pusillimonas noertemannii]|nr:histidine kinase [Pusillimonas noertemannii]
MVIDSASSAGNDVFRGGPFHPSLSVYFRRLGARSEHLALDAASALLLWLSMEASRASIRRLAAAACLLLLLCVGSAASAQSYLGQDIPLRWYEDKSAALDIEGFTALPADALAEQRSILSIGYTKSPIWLAFSLPASLFQAESRWLQLGPNFLDDVTLYYRPSAGGRAWSIHRWGDMWPDARGDIDYRFPVFELPPPSGAPGYDVVVRVRSTSAILLDGSLWAPQAFLKEAARETAFWSFYFGLAALSTALAVFMAFFLRRPLAWALCAFSLTYWLVACIQGYVDWLFGGRGLHLQHYLTGILTLLAYTSLLWVTTEALNLRERRPGLHRLMMAAIGLSLLLPLSIPLDFYDVAINIQGVLCISTALILAVGAWTIWHEEHDVMALVLGVMPILYVAAGLVALMSLFGWIPYDKHIYGIWQYVVMVNMLTVLGWAAYRIWYEAREMQEKRQLASELRLEREASFHQRQFIGMVSHEFRNPLAVITHAMENLQLPSVSEKQRRRRYQSIRRATHRLVQLTDNCLADSRLYADGLQLQIDTIDLLGVVRSAAEIVDGSADHRWRLTVQGLGVGEWTARRIPVLADAAMLRIAVSNVLDNAVKYSERGYVDIDVAFRNEFAVVGIRDRGPGIPKEDAALIFERHRRRRASPAAGHDPGGTGLGLYVARQIVQAHGGELVLVGSGPEGSYFELSVPQSGGGPVP